MELRKAARQKAKLRIGLSGPAGSGKSWSAILLAKGIVPDMSKVAIIDTEAGSADLYSHLGEFNVIRMNEDPNDDTPFTPEKYIAAIRMCEKAGIELCIIDSVTPEWDGKGGCLESNDRIANLKYKGNTWAAWNETTPRHQAFIDAIITSPMHVITCVRNKQDTVQVDGKVKKVGVKEIQREGFEYELTVNFNIDRDKHYAMASKDRTSMFDKRDPFIISEQTGKELKAWAEAGEDPAAVQARQEEIRKERAAKELAEKAEKEKLEKIATVKKRIMDLAKQLGFIQPAEREKILPAMVAFIQQTTADVYSSDLSLKELEEVRDHLSLTLDDRGKAVAPVQSTIVPEEPVI